jgi:glycosyltransferase involved in cell wall biosynthesis
MTRISVIMPSLLKERVGGTKNPEKKFRRSVNSFLDANANYGESELVVISDGCSATNRILSVEYKKQLERGVIKLFKLPPREDGSLFVGTTRQYGIAKASGIIVTNLDADDYFLPNHLKSIAEGFNPSVNEWGYFNCFRKLDNLKDVEELVVVEPELDKLFTTCVVWRRDLPVSWSNCDGLMDNKAFNTQLLKFNNRIKIYGAGYVIAHANIAI